jgi:hypothetical protein
MVGQAWPRHARASTILYLMNVFAPCSPCFCFDSILAETTNECAPLATIVCITLFVRFLCVCIVHNAVSSNPQ